MKDKLSWLIICLFVCQFVKPSNEASYKPMEFVFVVSGSSLITEADFNLYQDYLVKLAGFIFGARGKFALVVYANEDTVSAASSSKFNVISMSDCATSDCVREKFDGHSSGSFHLKGQNYLAFGIERAIGEFENGDGANKYLIAMTSSYVFDEYDLMDRHNDIIAAGIVPYAFGVDVTSSKNAVVTQLKTVANGNDGSDTRFFYADTVEEAEQVFVGAVDAILQENLIPVTTTKIKKITTTRATTNNTVKEYCCGSLVLKVKWYQVSSLVVFLCWILL